VYSDVFRDNKNTKINQKAASYLEPPDTTILVSYIAFHHKRKQTKNDLGQHETCENEKKKTNFKLRLLDQNWTLRCLDVGLLASFLSPGSIKKQIRRFKSIR